MVYNLLISNIYITTVVVFVLLDKLVLFTHRCAKYVLGGTVANLL